MYLRKSVDMIIINIAVIILCFFLMSWCSYINKANSLFLKLAKTDKFLDFQDDLEMKVLNVSYHTLYDLYTLAWKDYEVQIMHIIFTQPTISIMKNGILLCQYKDLPICFRVDLYRIFLQRYSRLRYRWFRWIFIKEYSRQGSLWYQEKAKIEIDSFLNNIIKKNNEVIL